MANVEITKLEKIYSGEGKESFRAVKAIDLEIHDKEFVVLVGPSGCGKSTTLRMIAGLEEITSGTIKIGDRVVNKMLPKDRDIAMVFQNYALYPHMTVFDNVAFGLKLLKYPKDEIKRRVQQAADILGLESLLKRKPKALSGGQRQRVALGRAIVRQPKVFLFDEPLSNLDAKMRVQMRTELTKLHAELDATMIYVTHDQVEAMTMGDRICVMKDGDIMQVAKPLELYNRPANMFVAGFIGSPPMNFFHGRLEKGEEGLRFIERGKSGDGFSIELDSRLSEIGSQYAGREIVFGIRPEDILDADDASLPKPVAVLETRIDVSEPMGAETFLYLKTDAHFFTARVHSEHEFEIGDRTRLAFHLKKAHFFDPETEKVISPQSI